MKTLTGWVWSLLLGITMLTGAENSMIVEHRLENGLKLLILEHHALPVVTVNIWYRVGSRHETAGIRGMAHLLEHMMFRGSENYGPEEHARLIKECGGDLNAGTTEDYTVYYERLPADQLELALRLEAERMHRLTLAPDLLSTELNVVKEEFRMYENSPYGELMLKLPPMLYPDHPYGWTPLGVFEDLDQGITAEKCRAFYQAHYAPNNAVVVVVGDVRSDEVIRLVTEYFGRIPPASSSEEPDLTLAPQNGLRRFSAQGRLPVPLTGIAFRIPEARHPDIIPLQVVSAILSSGESSRLPRILVREKELAVGAMGFPLNRHGPGYFVYGAAHLPNVPSARIEQAFWEEIARLQNEDVTDTELTKARNQLKAGKVFERYSTSSLAQSIGYAEVVMGDWRLYEREVAEFDKVTKDDLRRVARQYFTKENATIITFQPKGANPLLWLYGTLKSWFSGK